jgi:hypothetical protein
MRKRESSDDYECVNIYGFMGAYQMGMARLTDLGLAERKNPNGTSFANKAFKFKPPLTQEIFLASPELQDLIFEVHIRRHAKDIERRGLDISVVGLSGSCAVAHLLGIGGLKKFLNGEDGGDAFGTKASHYANQFKGYQLP